MLANPEAEASRRATLRGLKEVSGAPSSHVSAPWPRRGFDTGERARSSSATKPACRGRRLLPVGRPLGSGIADSPAGLAAWILDHDALSYRDITSAFVNGAPVGNLTRDEVLDSITLAWLTNTGVSSARLYHENAFGFFDAKGRVRSGRGDRVPEGALPGSAELGRARIPEPHLLQRGRSRRALRGLAGAATVLRRDPRRVH